MEAERPLGGMNAVVQARDDGGSPGVAMSEDGRRGKCGDKFWKQNGRICLWI